MREAAALGRGGVAPVNRAIQGDGTDMITGLIAGVVVLYALVLVGLIVFERRLLYTPFEGPRTPQAGGLTGFRIESLTTHDGLQLPVWRKDPEPGRATIVHFHGNGGGNHISLDRLKDLAERGYGIRAMEYRGYLDAPGQPTEPDIKADALALVDQVLAEGIAARDIVIYGWSLGSGVAVPTAVARPVRALILETPFTAAVDVAAWRFPILPVHWLMKDQWRSRDVAHKITTPTLILHGTKDDIIPFRHAPALLAMITAPKEMKVYDGADHMNLPSHGAMNDMATFIEAWR
jgi:uncharacterized protein